MQLFYKNNSIGFSETNKRKVLISAFEITLGLALVEVTGVATLCELTALNFSKSVTTHRLCSTVSVQNCLLDTQGSSLGEHKRHSGKRHSWPPLGAQPLLWHSVGVLLPAGMSQPDGALSTPGDGLQSHNLLFSLTMAVTPMGDSSGHVRHLNHS